MAGNNTQTTATAAADQGATSGAHDTTAATTPELDPFDAALAGELGGDTGEGQDGNSAEDENTGTDQGDQTGNPGNAGQGESEEGDTETEAEGTEELPDEIDPEKPPKGLENVPKPVWKRIVNQSKQIKELKAQTGQPQTIELTPTELHPLAHITDDKGLQEEIGRAKFARQLLANLKPEDFADDGKGRTVAEVVVGNQKYLLTEAEVKAKLDYADAVLDPDNVMDRKEFISYRNTHKPWQVAEKMVPDVFKKDTPAHAKYQALLKRLPQLATLPDHEYIIAAAVMGMQQYEETQGGKVKWVKMQLDDKGQVIPPTAQTQARQAPAKTAAPANAGQRPPARAGVRSTATEALAGMKDASPEDRLDAALSAELGL